MPPFVMGFFSDCFGNIFFGFFLGGCRAPLGIGLSVDCAVSSAVEIQRLCKNLKFK